MADETAATGRVPAVYVEMAVDYKACPLVPLSAELHGCRLECTTAGDAPPEARHLDFVLRADRAPPEAALAGRAPAAVLRYEGDGFHAYRLQVPPCTACFHPMLRAQGLAPLKATASAGLLHLSLVVDDPTALRALLAVFREAGASPTLQVLSPSQGHREAPAGTLEGLTPRQRQVLEDAYRAGYFHGKPLDVEGHAKGLGMCVSTYYHHLREGSHKVLQHVLRHGEP